MSLRPGLSIYTPAHTLMDTTPILQPLSTQRAEQAGHDTVNKGAADGQWHAVRHEAVLQPEAAKAAVTA